MGVQRMIVIMVMMIIFIVRVDHSRAAKFFALNLNRYVISVYVYYH